MYLTFEALIPGFIKKMLSNLPLKYVINKTVKHLSDLKLYLIFCTCLLEVLKSRSPFGRVIQNINKLRFADPLVVHIFIEIFITNEANYKVIQCYFIVL